MTLEDLFPLFSPTCSMARQILLVNPADFYRLEGRALVKTRMFMLVSSGSLTLTFGDRSYEVKAYVIFDVLDMLTVRISKCSPDLRAWCLFITYEFASESLKNLHLGPQERILEQMHFPCQYLLREESDAIERQLELLQGILANSKHCYRKELVRLYFRSFSLELGNIMFSYDGNEASSPASSVLSKRDFIATNFLKLVSGHFTVERNIDFYANVLNISSKHLARIIKEVMGRTPHSIINEELVHYAMLLLEDENIPIGQIAEELHFSDQASFSKFFKKQMKLSPLAYRQKGLVLAAK